MLVYDPRMPGAAASGLALLGPRAARRRQGFSACDRVRQVTPHAEASQGFSWLQEVP
jgi:hypothetical protein